MKEEVEEKVEREGNEGAIGGRAIGGRGNME